MAGASLISSSWSSNVSSISGPKVFINFGGKQLCQNFVKCLVPALMDLNLNVFIDELEKRGKHIFSLFDRKSESRIALVIFAEGYTESKYCLDELVQIKECMDQKNLRVIPIFYRIAPGVVQLLKGNFGDQFRDLIERCHHQPERHQKWIEALASVSQLFALSLPKYSEKSDEDFINLIIKEVGNMRSYTSVPARTLTHTIHKASNSIVPASSFVGRYLPKDPQIFINFRGIKLRKNFISFLAAALRDARFNVFMDEDEPLGSDLDNLFTRINESNIALVIFSKDYTTSKWCLDELAEIKKCKDQGHLRVIPIFYKIEPLVVKQLRGKFGDGFRDMKRNHQHEPERTQEWKDALVSIPLIKGMSLPEQSNMTDRDFINSMVDDIHLLLEHMESGR
ncbi:protein PHLOEM PROTEIN 2-LIKE A5 isoform X2 [Capsella rubella]|uniref:protein PHLOEM PROTEIN 2-LIKE A5 isoform X2 n=1 Tax=Capsella rubella TaxID=81985 RepID=UPI000CD4C2EE|nr:protein PHLOEM PROTEIN 2-LIKE A5 isoform X2 [Capsella rubella]